MGVIKNTINMELYIKEQERNGTISYKRLKNLKLRDTF